MGHGGPVSFPAHFRSVSFLVVDRVFIVEDRFLMGPHGLIDDTVCTKDAMLVDQVVHYVPFRTRTPFNHAALRRLGHKTANGT